MGEAGGEQDLHDLLTLLAPQPAAPRPGVPVSGLRSATPEEQRALLLGSAPRPNDPQEAAQRAKLGEQIEKEARFVPGVPPNIVVLADGTAFDLKTHAPAQNLNPIDAGYVKLAHKNYAALPKYTDYKTAIPPLGRPFQYSGDPTPEEQNLTQRFLAGDMKAAGPLAKLRMSRLAYKPRPGIDKFMRPITLAGLSLALGALAGPLAAGPIGTIGAGAIGGAVGGGATTAVATHGDLEKTLYALLAGGVGGAAGGAINAPVKDFFGGGIPGGAAGGAAAGATTAGARAGLSSLLGGDVNPWDILISTVGGGIGGGARAAGTQALTGTGSDPGGVGDFAIPPSQWERMLVNFLGGQAGAGASQSLRGFLPDGGVTGIPTETSQAPFPTPEMTKQLNDGMQAIRRAQIDDAMRDFQSKLDEFNARKAEALAGFNAKQEEFQQRVAAAQAARDAARERLRQQAASYLEQVKAARRTPLPPIPVPQAPAAPPPPDPFAPSAALQGQSFSPEGFPTTVASDFPISQEGAPAAMPGGPPPAAKATTQQLPLNIQQIQAALAARRRR